MFPVRYFGSRYFAPRYFAKVGSSPPAPVSSIRFLVSDGEINMTGQGEGTVGYEVKLAQTTTLGPTVIFTADRTGLYRVSGSAVTSTAGVTGTLALSVVWGTYTKTFFTGLSLSVLGSSTGYSQLLHLTAADTVSYTSTITGGTGSPKYDLFVTVERLWTAT